ncbi:MAG: hydroxymethylbilane synthase [Acidobacteriota bacterium]
MSADRALRLGTRGSDLALWQANHVKDLIAERLGLSCAIVIVKTAGDRIQNVAFRKMEGKGFFTKELQDALLEERVDLVVHSLKDLPTEEPDGLEVAAILERANPADLLLASPGLLQPAHDNPLGLPAGAVLGTSSLRRAAQALAHNPGLEIRALRGNVPTRVRKLREEGFDAILLAAAGVARLELELDDLDQLVLAPEVMLPAPGQGALAAECRAGDPLTAPIRDLHDHGIARCVEAERRLLELLGGGCHLPLGCLATERSDGVRLQAALAQDPETAASICHQALRLAAPDAGGA